MDIKKIFTYLKSITGAVRRSGNFSVIWRAVCSEGVFVSVRMDFSETSSPPSRDLALQQETIRRSVMISSEPLL